MKRRIKYLITACLMLFAVAGGIGFALANTAVITHTPVTTIAKGSDFAVTAEVTGTVGTVTLNIRTLENAAYSATEMTDEGGGSYTVTVPAGKIITSAFDYYIGVFDAEGALITSSGTANAPHVVEVTGGTASDLIITEALAVSARRFDFVEVYNNTNRPVDLKKIEISLYEFVLVNGVYNSTAPKTTKLAFVDNDGNKTVLDESADNYFLQPGGAFIMGFGNVTNGTGGPASGGYGTEYYVSNLVGACAGYTADSAKNLIGGVNVFAVGSSVNIDPSANYTASNVGSGFEILYNGIAITRAATGMSESGASVMADKGTNAASGSVQFSADTFDFADSAEPAVTKSWQKRITDSKDVVINPGIVNPRQVPKNYNTVSVPDYSALIKPELNEVANTDDLFLASAAEQKTFDTADFVKVVNNEYINSEFTVNYEFKKGSDSFAPITDTFTINGVGTYTIKANFTAVSPAEFDAYSISKEFVFIADITAPVISDVSVSNAQYLTELTFSAKVVDDYSLHDNNPVILCYRTVSGGVFREIAMTASSGNIFSGAISGADVSIDNLEYYIKAADLAGNDASTSPAAIAITMPAYDTQKDTKPLYITEVANIGAKAQDFIEIYNNTTRPFPLSDIGIDFYNPVMNASGFTMKINNSNKLINSDASAVTDKFIPAGGVIVVSPEQFELSAFNTFYNTSLTADNYFWTNIKYSPTSSNSISQIRAFGITVKGEDIVKAAYGMTNSGTVLNDTRSESNKTSCLYNFREVDITDAMEVTYTFQNRVSHAHDKPATPGTAESWQIPSSKISIVPAITSNGNIQKNTTGDTIDLLDNINIDASFAMSDFNITATVSIDGGADTAVADINNYSLSDWGTYSFRLIFASSGNPKDFADITVTYNVLVKNLPAVTAEKDNTAKLITGKVDMIDPKDFFTVDDGAFAGQYNIVISATKGTLLNGKIVAGGDYTIKVTVEPKVAGEFEAFDEVFNITVTQFTSPVISVPNAEVNAKIINGAAIDISGFYSINLNSYPELIPTVSVTKDGVAVTFINGKLPAEAGTYVVIITIAGIDGEFEEIIGTFTVQVSEGVAPSISADADKTINAKKKGEMIDISALYSVNGNDYTGYATTVKVTKDGADITVEKGKISAQAGEYSIVITVSGAGFETVTKTIKLTVEIEKSGCNKGMAAGGTTGFINMIGGLMMLLTGVFVIKKVKRGTDTKN